jgi:two-component system chemotaxis response regulator CheY
MNAPFVATAGNGAAQVLPKLLDLAAAAPLYATIVQAATDKSPLRLDASQVELMQLACMQVLLAAMKSGADMTIHAPSQAFLDAFDELGLAIDYSPDPCPADSPAAEQPAEAQPAAVPEAAKSGRMRILTIDDSKTMRDMLMLTLADAGFEVLQAVDGQDGVDLLRTEVVDVVITDINMPRMDGYEVVRQLRARPEHRTTPILMLTTESELEKKNIAREIGATGWMVKPFDPDRLIATLHKVAR